MAEAQQKHGGIPRYIFPLLGAAIPVAAMIAKKAAGMCRERKIPEAKLLRQSNLDYRSAAETGLKYVKGTPIEVELSDKEGKAVWEVEILPHRGGAVQELRIDARSGELMEQKSKAERAPSKHPGHIPCAEPIDHSTFRHPISEP